MLAEAGDKSFLMGNVLTDSPADIFESGIVKSLSSARLESMPDCRECAFVVYCGSDPIRLHAEGRQPDAEAGSTGCRQREPVFEHLFSRILDGDEATLDIFWAWITSRRLSDISIGDRP